MEVFRISREVYARQLSSSGTANRWNLRGQHVIYTGSSRSLSSLELIVHKSNLVPDEDYKVMVISVGDHDHLVRQIKINELPENWRSVSAYARLQQIGAEWYDDKESLLLKIPSAIIPYEYNFIINTEHPDYRKNVRLVRTEDYFWDDRLF